jgi:hypothetical protein
MDQLYSEVLGKLKNRGLAPFEIIELIKDFDLLNRTNHNCTLAAINEELESLGWGIYVMDKALCEKLTFLIDRGHIQSFKMYIGQG